MATSPFVYGIVGQILQELKDEQTPSQTKSNTFVSTVGLVITVVTTIVLYLLDSGFDWVPTWLVHVVPILGFIGTTFGVSKTKNYVTDTTIRQAERKINEKIGLMQEDKIPKDIVDGNVAVADAVVERPHTPVVVESYDEVQSTDSVDDRTDLSDYFDQLAKDIAKRG